MKKILITLVFSLVSSCSSITSVQPTNNIEKGTFIAKVSNSKGASIPVSINFESSFNIKANQNGVPGKQASDIAKVDAYLFKLPIGFNGTNPFGDSNANLVTSFLNTSKTGSTFNLLFTNVPGLTPTLHYYVGIVVKDSSGNVINKPPSTAWTAETTTNTPALLLSTTGVGVNESTFEVTSTTALSIDVDLIDLVGAKIETNATVTVGSDEIAPVTAY